MSLKEKQFRPHWNKEFQSLIIKIRNFPKHIQKHCLELAVRSATSGNEITFDENKKGATIETKKSSRIKNIDDLIKHCEIDLDVWEIERYVVNKWEVGSNVEGTIIVEPLFQIKAWLKKNTDILNIKKLRDELINEVKSFSPKYPTFNYKPIKKGHLLEVNIFDLHF